MSNLILYQSINQTVYL